MKVYDLEHHYYNPELIQYLKTRKTPPMYTSEGILVYHQGAFLPIGVPSEILDILSITEMITDLGEARLRKMDEAGVDTAILSSGALIESLPKKKLSNTQRLLITRLQKRAKSIQIDLSALFVFQQFMLMKQ